MVRLLTTSRSYRDTRCIHLCWQWLACMYWPVPLKCTFNGNKTAVRNGSIIHKALAMAWQEHVDALIGTGHVQNASIHGLDGVCWAASEHFRPATEEIRTLVYAIDNEQAAALLPAHGLTVANEKYSFLRRDPGHNAIGKTGFGALNAHKQID